MPQDRRSAWRALESAIDRTSETYIRQFGETAYALMNAITDMSTRPPVRVCGHCLLSGEQHSQEHEELAGDRGRPYCFIRRERHSLQRMAGIWLTEFSRSIRLPGFDLDGYLKAPSRGLLRRASQRAHGRLRRSRRARRR